MVQEAADIVSAELADPPVAAGIVKEVPPVLPEALMNVHPGTVVHEERLWHERYRLPVG